MRLHSAWIFHGSSCYKITDEVPSRFHEIDEIDVADLMRAMVTEARSSAFMAMGVDEAVSRAKITRTRAVYLDGVRIAPEMVVCSGNGFQFSWAL